MIEPVMSETIPPVTTVRPDPPREIPLLSEGRSGVALRVAQVFDASRGTIESLRRQLLDLEARYNHLVASVANGVALRPPAPLIIHRDARRLEILRAACERALALNGSAEASWILRRALEETR